MYSRSRIAVAELSHEWEKEENVSSGSVVERIRGNERETQEKLDNLITLYLDGDIPKANYLAKKDELLLQKVSLCKGPRLLDTEWKCG